MALAAHAKQSRDGSLERDAAQDRGDAQDRGEVAKGNEGRGLGVARHNAQTPRDVVAVNIPTAADQNLLPDEKKVSGDRRTIVPSQNNAFPTAADIGLRRDEANVVACNIQTPRNALTPTTRLPPPILAFAEEIKRCGPQRYMGSPKPLWLPTVGKVMLTRPASLPPPKGALAHCRILEPSQPEANLPSLIGGKSKCKSAL